jgi:hypothetical protein
MLFSENNFQNDYLYLLYTTLLFLFYLCACIHFQVANKKTRTRTRRRTSWKWRPTDRLLYHGTAAKCPSKWGRKDPTHHINSIHLSFDWIKNKGAFTLKQKEKNKKIMDMEHEESCFDDSLIGRVVRKKFGEAWYLGRVCGNKKVLLVKFYNVRTIILIFFF